MSGKLQGMCVCAGCRGSVGTRLSLAEGPQVWKKARMTSCGDPCMGKVRKGWVGEPEFRGPTQVLTVFILVLGQGTPKMLSGPLGTGWISVWKGSLGCCVPWAEDDAVELLRGPGGTCG